MGYERLTAQDASFLHLETPTSPMHVGSLSLLELPKASVEGRADFLIAAAQ